MAKLVLAEGERVLRRLAIRELVGSTQIHRYDTYDLILTDRRVVVLRTNFGPKVFGAFGAFGALIARAASGGPRIEHEIRRDAFGEAEVTEKQTLVVRSKGSGYAMTWFEVALLGPDQWAEWLHRWAAGEPFDAPPPPTAKLVQR